MFLRWLLILLPAQNQLYLKIVLHQHQTMAHYAVPVCLLLLLFPAIEKVDFL